VNFSKTIDESEQVEADVFVERVKQVIELLSRVEETKSDNLTINGKLVNLKPEGHALIIGDLHGDLISLETIITQSKFLEEMETNKRAIIIFLGDYGDRGAKSPELYYAVLSLKLAYPKQVVLVRGNHEGPSDLMASPHDLPTFLRRKFGDTWVQVYQTLSELFGCFYNAVYVKDRYLMVHGGLPSKVRSLKEIAVADKLHPRKTFLEELLWSDPDEQAQGVYPSPRGAGYIFGKTVTGEVLQRLGAKILIRGHEPVQDGFAVNHEGKILTLFSCRGPPYFNNFGAYLDLPLEKTPESAYQLLPYIYKF